MADNAGTSPAGSEPAEPQPTTPPRDQRPRPKYGELAPEGWTWSPPPGANPHADVTPDVPATTNASVNAPTQHTPASPYLSDASKKKHRAAPAWDRPVTFGLLVLGLLGLFSAIAILGSVPEAVQMLYTQEKLGTYTPAAGVAGLILTGKITQSVIWVATAAFSIFVTTRHRRAFYLPLIGGVLSVVAIFVFLSVILTTDPTLLNFYSKQ